MTANAVAKIGTTRQTTRKITSYSGEEKQIRRAEGKLGVKLQTGTEKQEKTGKTEKLGKEDETVRKPENKTVRKITSSEGEGESGERNEGTRGQQG